jgi:2-isopropylmalate synthase
MCVCRRSGRSALTARPFRLIEATTISEATIKLSVKGIPEHTAAEGNGPVSALDAALRKALAPMWPRAMDLELVDYKVRIIDGARGTGRNGQGRAGARLARALNRWR